MSTGSTGPTQGEIDAKTSEYKAATADRETKGETAQTDADARDAAIAKATTSFNDYITALELEHQLEDELEAMQVAHEPPPIPTEPFAAQTPPAAQQKKK
jgi:hypothetical protein